MLDHTTNEACYGGKMGIDATRKMKGEAGFEREWPPIVKMDPAVKERYLTTPLTLQHLKRTHSTAFPDTAELPPVPKLTQAQKQE